MEEQVIQLIETHHKKSGGKCGLLIVSLKNQLNTDFKTLRPILEKLYKNKSIIIRDGIHGKLIFKHVNNPQPRK